MSTKMNFPKEILLDLLDMDSIVVDGNHFQKIKDELVDTTRWSKIYQIVFLFNKQEYYTVGYSVGATEQQDESPWEYEGDNIECVRVYPREVTTIVYSTEPV